MRIYRVLFYLLIFSLPFFPRQLDTKITYLINGFAILLLPVFFTSIRRVFQKKKEMIIFFVLFLFSSAISTFFSIDPKISLYQFALFVSYFIVFVSLTSLFKNFEDKQKLVLVFLASSFLVSLIFLYNTLFLNNFNQEKEGVSLLWIYYGHGHLSSLLVFSLPLCFYFIFKSSNQKKILVLLSAVAFVLTSAFFFTLARASILSFLGSLIFSAFLFKFISTERKIFFSLCFLAVVGLSVLVFSTLYRGAVKTWNADPVRAAAWQDAFYNFKNNPLTGSGPDTFRIISLKSEVKTPLKTFYAHNFFLQSLSDAGLFGFLSAAGLIISIFIILFNKIKKTAGPEKFFFISLWIGLLASTFNSMVDFDWQLPTVFFIFWSLLALIF